MLKKILLVILLSALFPLSSCGKGNDETAIVDYVVVVNAGGIAQITYFDSNGNEQRVPGEADKNTYRVTVSAKEGSLLYLSAIAATPGEGIAITAKIISNGQQIVSETAEGEDGAVPVISVDGYAIIPEYQNIDN